MNAKVILLAAFAALAGCGCATKTRNAELDGMYLSETGTLAIGSIDISAAPQGEESASIKYSEDNAWLSPSMKLHEIKIYITGTNSTQNVGEVVKSICTAFVAAKESKFEASTSAGADAKTSEISRQNE